MILGYADLRLYVCMYVCTLQVWPCKRISLPGKLWSSGMLICGFVCVCVYVSRMYDLVIPNQCSRLVIWRYAYLRLCACVCVCMCVFTYLECMTSQSQISVVDLWSWGTLICGFLLICMRIIYLISILAVENIVQSTYVSEVCFFLHVCGLCA